MSVSKALSLYGEEHAPHVADPARIGYAIDALDEFFGNLKVSDISGAVCRRYASQRRKRGLKDPETGECGPPRPVSPGTIRRELGTLRAALEHCHREGHLLSTPGVVLPDRPSPRDRWLTKSEARRLLNAARNSTKARHLTRFILIGLYTGTRKSAILGLQWFENVNGGWIDTKRGLMRRRGSAQRETKKRQTTIHIPRQLLAHMRRWEAQGGRWVVTDRGARLGDIRSAWKGACADAGLHGISPHVLRHTAITWAMQEGAKKWDVAGYFGVSMETLEGTYGHHHPDFQKSAVEAMERRR